MADLLFEIGTEEIPARFMRKALAELEAHAKDLLTKARISFGAIKTMGTDRRLALQVKGLAEKQSDLDQELKGPPKRIAMDAQGNLTPAAHGFAKKSGIDSSKLSFKQIGNEEYLYVQIQEKGKAVKEVLPEILKQVVSNIHLPIAMRWGDLDMQFIRPIHWMVCLLDDKVVPFEIAGITAGKKSDGHRFLNKKPVVVAEAKVYEKVLEQAFVIADQEKRKASISKALAKVEKKLGLHVVPNDDLLDEVTFINEYPEAVIGEIDEKYLSVPQECLIATMQKNQKYFPLVDAKGLLTKYFVVLANNVTARSEKNIIVGNAKVVTARLEDAKFFYEEDKKVKMDHWVENLKKVTYHEKIGTIYGKIERIVTLAEKLADMLGFSAEEKQQAKRTAFLCKADLDSKMVFEFPELQGIMGKYYATAAGEGEVVASAILDHWKPRYAGEDIASVSKIAAVVAIADKMDSIAGCFSVGLIPSSSSDPYALRRAAQGIVAIMLEKKLDLSLSDVISWALQPHKAEKLKDDILKFFKGRVKFILQDKNVRYDLIDAVLAVPQADIFTTVQMGLALQSVSTAKDFSKFVDTGVRVFRLSKEAKATQVAPEHFAEAVEKTLFDALEKAECSVQETFSGKAYDRVLSVLSGLVALVDAFFVDVLVMDEDINKRNNRLAILKRLDQLFKKVGDFEKIVV